MESAAAARVRRRAVPRAWPSRRARHGNRAAVVVRVVVAAAFRPTAGEASTTGPPRTKARRGKSGCARCFGVVLGSRPDTHRPSSSAAFIPALTPPCFPLDGRVLAVTMVVAVPVIDAAYWMAMAVVEVHPEPIGGPWVEGFVLDQHVISSRPLAMSPSTCNSRQPARRSANWCIS